MEIDEWAPRAPFGTWEDPRVAGPGGCGGAIPEAVWPASEEELEEAVDLAVCHATFFSVDLVNMPGMHVVVDPVWLSIEWSFERREVRLVSHLALVGPGDRLVDVVSDRFVLRQLDGELRAEARLSARPFVPVHFGQELIDLALFSRNVIRDLPAHVTPAWEKVHPHVLPLWCGTSMMMWQAQYAGIPDPHPFDSEDW